MNDQHGLIEFRNVSKVFAAGKQTTEALRQINFTVAASEFVSIIGESGSGKTTILRLAAGLDFPTSGIVSFRGEPIRGPDRRRGLVFQSYGLFPWLTVRENVGFGLRTERDTTAKIEQWINALGLDRFADAYPKALSGGMRQRVALGRALVVEPDLLLLDEPFAALDSGTRETVRDLVADLVIRSGCSAILVTHDVRDALLLSDRVLALSKRPAVVLQTYAVPGVRPRSEAVIHSNEFVSLHAHVVASSFERG